MEFGSRVCFPQISQIYAEWLSENLRDPTVPRLRRTGLRETMPLEVYTSRGIAEKCHHLSRFDLRNLPN